MATPAHRIEPKPAAPEPPPRLAADGGRPRRTVVRNLLLAVGLPTALAAFYYGVVASDVYVAEARYAIRSVTSSPTSGLLSTFLGSSISGNNAEDAEIVRDYILSRDMLDKLDARMNLRAHYESQLADWIARLESDASAEDYLDYYRDMVTIGIDEGANITTLQTRAFSPQVARELAATILELSERLVNQMSATIAEDTLQFARKDLDEAEDRVRSATLALTTYRTQSRSVDPGEETSAVLGIVTQLEAQLAAARAELSEARSFMRQDSARVRNLTARTEALESQVARERERLASEGGRDLTSVIFGYEPLALDQKLAEQAYTSALASLEAARAEAQRKQRYLIAFVQPNLPDEALEPERIENTLLVLFASSLAFGIGALVWSAIKEHARL